MKIRLKNRKVRIEMDRVEASDLLDWCVKEIPHGEESRMNDFCAALDDTLADAVVAEPEEKFVRLVDFS